MLLGNYSPFNRLPLRARTGPTTAGASFAFSPGNYACPGWSHMIWQDGASAASPEIGYPSGYYDRGFKLPLGVSSSTTKRQFLSGPSCKISLSVSGTGIRARPGSGLGTISLIGTGGGSLVVLGNGQGVISISGIADIVATLLMSGVADLGLLGSGSMRAMGLPSGLGIISAGGIAYPLGIGWMEGTTDIPSVITPERVARAVWNSIASEFVSPGTMGKILNDGGSGVTPQQIWEYATRTLSTGGESSIAGEVMAQVVETGLSLEQVLRILVAVAAGKSEITNLGGGSATVVFRDTNDAKDRVIADMVNSERSSITLDVT